MCIRGTTKQTRAPGWRAYVVWIGIMALVLAFYASCGTWSFPCSSDPLRARATIYHNLYAHQVEGFLQGKLSLSIEPGPSMRALPNPYDGRSHWPYHPYDVAYYAGQFHFYHGIVPAVTLFLPVRLVWGVYLPENAAALIFFVAALSAQVWLMWALVRRWLPEAPVCYYHGAVLALGLTLPVPYILAGAAFYHVAIMSCVCWLSVAGVCVWRAVTSRTPGRWWVLACGSLVLCTGSRPHFAALAVLFMVGLTVMMRQEGRRTWGWCLAVCVTGACLLGMYNYLRFGTPFEYGVRYLLCGVEKRVYPPDLVPYNLRLNGWMYFLNPPRVADAFPYLTVRSEMPAWYPAASRYLVLEATLGLLWCAPYILPALAAGAAGCVAAYARRTALVPRPLLAVVVAALSAAGVIVVMVSAASVTTMRYLLDFGSVVVFVAWLLAAWCDQCVLRRAWLRWCWRACIGGCLVCGVVAQCLLGFQGHWDQFSRYNPWLFATLQQHAPRVNELWPARQAISNLYANGALRTRAEMIADTNGMYALQHGLFEVWYPDGTLQQRGRYHRGQPEGRWTWWHANGARAMEGTFRHGVHHGWWCYWNTNAVLTREVFVLEGATIKEIKYE